MQAAELDIDYRHEGEKHSYLKEVCRQHSTILFPRQNS